MGCPTAAAGVDPRHQCALGVGAPDDRRDHPGATGPRLLRDLDPEHLFALGQRFAPLRDEGTLIVGSGLTHGLPYVREYMMGRAGAPTWSTDFDAWAAEALARGDLDTLFAFRDTAPGMPYAHRTAEHLAPLFVAMGAATAPDAAPTTAVSGCFMGLSKRSVELA